MSVWLYILQFRETVIFTLRFLLKSHLGVSSWSLIWKSCVEDSCFDFFKGNLILKSPIEVSSWSLLSKTLVWIFLKAVLSFMLESPVEDLFPVWIFFWISFCIIYIFLIFKIFFSIISIFHFLNFFSIIFIFYFFNYFIYYILNTPDWQTVVNILHLYRCVSTTIK